VEEKTAAGISLVMLLQPLISGEIIAIREPEG
jgi:hypothetical protein